MMQEKILRTYLLETLSFYEKMSLERIILEFDSHVLEGQPNWTMDILRLELDKLVIDGLVTASKQNSEVYYLRQLAPRGLMAQLKYWWRRTRASIKTK
jgi:hypothetical protein